MKAKTRRRLAKAFTLSIALLAVTCVGLVGYALAKHQWHEAVVYAICMVANGVNAVNLWSLGRFDSPRGGDETVE